VNHWQTKLILAAWAYALCSMVFVLVTNRDLLASRLSELFREFPDIAVALAIVLALLPQLVAVVILDAVFYSVIVLSE